jgi:hypothetical protein
MKTRLPARALGGTAHRAVCYALSLRLGILPFMSTTKFRVYLRWPEQRTSDSTTTESREVADFALQLLKDRSDLRGQGVGAAMTRDGKQLKYFDFKTGIEKVSEPEPTPRPEKT